jgi:hypothetical protein
VIDRSEPNATPLELVAHQPGTSTSSMPPLTRQFRSSAWKATAPWPECLAAFARLTLSTEVAALLDHPDRLQAGPPKPRGGQQAADPAPVTMTPRMSTPRFRAR